VKAFFAVMRRNHIRYGGFLIFHIIASIVAAAALVLMTHLRGEMGETALQGDITTLVRFLIALTAIAAVRAFFSALHTLTLERFSGKAGHKLRRGFIGYLLRVPYAKFEKAGSGESLSIYTNDIWRAESLVGGGWSGGLSFVTSIIQFASVLIFMFWVSPLLTLIILGLVPFLAVFQMLASKPIQKKQIAQSEASAEFNAVVNDSLQNISTIAAYGLEDVLEERYLVQYDKFMDAFIAFIKALAVSVSAGMMVSVTPMAVIFSVAAFAVIGGNMTIAEFIAYSAMLVVVGGEIGNLSERLGQLQEFMGSTKRLLGATAEEIEVASTASGTKKSSAISFKNVSFGYNADTELLAVEDISFEIPLGSRVAFVGGSGSGKSTLLKLLLGLYDPTEGKIFIGGKTDFAKAELRSHFAYVPQDSFLFPESIGENITLEGTITDLPRLEKACADAGILDFIQGLPNGFDSVLSEASENISGGQRQRIAMARAFYRDAPIILFDEATSALDPITEASILQSFDNVTAGKTVIMVAHRVSAIAACDTIVVLNEGKLSGMGTHQELLATNPVYQQLYEGGE